MITLLHQVAHDLAHDFLHERRIGVRSQLPQRFAHDLPKLVVSDFHKLFFYEIKKAAS